MTKKRIQVALDHGEGLPGYPDSSAARTELFAARDEALALLLRAGEAGRAWDADYTPASLKTLEKWYFELWKSQSFWTVGISRSEFETGMAMYFGEVLVRNVDGFVWTVDEFAFQPGKFEVGVQKETLKIMLARFTDIFARPENKKMESIFRDYRKYAKSGAAGSD